MPEYDPNQQSAAVLATRTSRLIASLLDFALLMAVLLPVLFLSFPETLASFNEETDDFQEAVLVLALGLAIFLLLNAYTLQTRGQSLGKIILKIKIVDVSGSKASALQIFVARLIPFWVIGKIPGPFWLFDIINPMLIFRNDRRCLHDIIAKTKVVIVNQEQ